MKNLPFVSIGDNTSRVFGLSPRDRANRFAAKADMIAVAEIPTDGPFVVANLGYAWDPAWLQHVASHPGLVLTQNGVPELAHLTDAGQQAVVDVIKEQSPLQAVDGLNIQPKIGRAHV